ncbi:MAG: hypothetical protein QOD95_2614 [Gammaproteobacteria bacterium]|jgi:hypothetical protein|nr:hypothetical protein [Gammaproteobacteria bacterium]
MHNAAMSFDIKALLTLLLLKQGTSSKDIQTAVNLTAAARLMVAEEYAESAPSEDLEAGNVTNIRLGRRADTVAGARPFEPHADAMNSDIKALLMLLLLQNGASSREIQTTLRLAARTRGLMAEELLEAPEEEIAAAVARTQETRPTPKQALRNDHLAPVPLREFAA